MLPPLAKLVYEKRRYMFYRSPEEHVARVGAANRAIRVYRSWEEVPASFREAVLPSPRSSVLYYRLQRGDAKLLCLSEDDRHLQAYGWIQSWNPFRRRFSHIARDGIMLGPYWTSPDERGKGLYGRLLRHSLHLCRLGIPVLIFTAPDNLASQKGITKAGFDFIGEWEVTAWCRLLIGQRQIAVEAARRLNRDAGCLVQRQ